AAVEGLDDAADDLVAGVLLEFDLVTPRREAIERGHHVQELAGGACQNAGGFFEEVVKLFFAGNQAETHRDALQGEGHVGGSELTKSSSNCHSLFMKRGLSGLGGLTRERRRSQNHRCNLI